MLNPLITLLAALAIVALPSLCVVAPANAQVGMASKPAPKMCGGIAGLRCAGEKEFCEFKEGTCRIPDMAGVCKPKPELCPMMYAPVCGCDGKTYSNSCIAAAAGISVIGKGRCAGE